MHTPGYKGFITNPKSKLNLLWAGSLKALLYSKPKLHTYNNLLPKLPLPSVEHTIKQIKKSAGESILVNSGEEKFKLFEKACDDFIRDTKKAQRLLYLRSWYKDSWLADLWTDYWLIFRDFLGIGNTNFLFFYFIFSISIFLQNVQALLVQ